MCLVREIKLLDQTHSLSVPEERTLYWWHLRNLVVHDTEALKASFGHEDDKKYALLYLRRNWMLKPLTRDEISKIHTQHPPQEPYPSVSWPSLLFHFI